MTGLANWLQSVTFDLRRTSVRSRRQSVPNRRRTLRLRQLLQFIASLGSLLARLACRRSMPICGRGCMFAENPSPLPDATTDAMVDLRHFHALQGEKGKRQEERVTVCFQAQFLVTFRLSTERNVKRLVGAASSTATQDHGSRSPYVLRARATVWPCGADLPPPSVESVVHLALME